MAAENISTYFQRDLKSKLNNWWHCRGFE